jgi:hypothetical protein
MPDFQTTVWNGERIYMVDFGRGRTGLPHRRFPDVDHCGYHDAANAAEHGPITSAMAGQTRVTINFHRTEISTGARLHAVSTNTALVNITSPAGGQLTAARTQAIQFTAGANPGRAAIEIRYHWADGPVIGRIYVQIYQRIRVLMRVHLVTVNGMAHANNVLSKNCPTRADKVARIQEYIDGANEIWIPHGIVFFVDGAVVDTAWGAVQVPTGNQSIATAECYQAGALSPNRSAAHVNVYMIPATTSGMTALGVPVRWARQRNFLFPTGAPAATQHLGNGLYVVTSSAATPRTIAHEMGHYMTLCSLNAGTGAVQQWHSTGDTPGNIQVRDDVVTRRRIMYPVATLLNATETWRNNTGYGAGLKGGFITYRQLPAAQDITFEESGRARTAAGGANFYAF